MFKDFYYQLNKFGYRFNATRLDLAFDGVPFSPKQFYDAILEDALKQDGDEPVIRSITERETLRFESSPLKMREDGSGIGQDTCYFGDRGSMRFLRVYNKRGSTRLEFEIKEGRANEIANELFICPIDLWPRISIGHLRDFIDVFKPWWTEFIGDTERAYKKLNFAKDVSLEKTKNWLIKQVAPSLSAVLECTNGDFLLEMDEEGRKRMEKRYRSLISAHKSVKPKKK